MGKLLNRIVNVFKRKRSAENERQQGGHDVDPLSSSIQSNIGRIRGRVGNSGDVVTAWLRIGANDGFDLGYAYTQGLADPAAVQSLLREANEYGYRCMTDGRKPRLDFIRNVLATVGQVRPIADFPSLLGAILAGETVLFPEGIAEAWAVGTKGGQERQVEDPSSQSVVRGPREGFTENVGTNTALLRRRLKTADLWMESYRIGKRTKTEVRLLYLKGIANDKIVEEARARLNRIDIDGILESGNIEELIQDETFTPFPTVFNSERPDVIASGLLEGRLAILVDGTPFVLLAPALFVQFFQSAEDYYQRADFASLIRLLRYVCFFISLLAPSLYIAITTFHQELIPSSLLFSLAAQREGIPFPAFIEALIMEVTFEILREAGVRLPKMVGQAVSIVGALVIGQAAVEAGLVSPAMVIVVAITAISNFVIPSFNMGITIRILRFLMMVFAATFGLFGVTVGLIATVQHLCSLRSLGVPYMAPMAPFVLEEQKDTLIRMPLWSLLKRPRYISRSNVIRENGRPTAYQKRGRS